MFFAACGGGSAQAKRGVAPAPVGTTGTTTLVLVGTTDVHGHVEAAREVLHLGGQAVETTRGGSALLGGYLTNLRARHPGRVVVVDSGDMMQGTMVSNLGEGGAMVRAMNALGYTAAAVGNHEFDFGPEGAHAVPQDPGEDPRGVIKARAAESRFPWLTANITDDKGAPFASPIKRFVVVDIDGVRVGIVGGTTEDTPRTTIAPNLVGLRVEPLGPSVARAAAAARAAGATVVVAIVHAGGDCKELDDPRDLGTCDAGAEGFRLARALAAAGEAERVDAIFGGHTHQGVAQVVAGIPVAQAFCDGKSFARIDLTVDRKTGRVVPGGARVHRPVDLCAEVADGVASCVPGRARGRRLVPATYEGSPVAPDAKVQAAIAADLAKAAEVRARKLGVHLTTPMRRAYKTESALGNLVADVVRRATSADVGLANGGGLRDDLDAGELTYGQLFEALPFDNRLARIRLSGAAFRRWITSNLRSHRGVLSFSGARVAARCERGDLVVDVTLDDGRKLADDQVYTVGASDFLALGGDDFGGVRPGLAPDAVAVDHQNPTLRDAVAAALPRLGATLRGDDPMFYDPARPRLALPMPRPVICPR